MLTKLFAAPLRLLGVATVAFSFGVWCTGTFYYGPRIQKERSALMHYKAQLTMAHAQLIEAQAKVVIQTEIQYRDRIKIVKEKGETIIKEVPIYVTQADTDRFGVNVGFVRHYNAAFTGQPAGVATKSDRESAGISIAKLAEVNAYNANICWRWRKQALGLKALYLQLQNSRTQSAKRLKQ